MSSTLAAPTFTAYEDGELARIYDEKSKLEYVYATEGNAAQRANALYNAKADAVAARHYQEAEDALVE